MLQGTSSFLVPRDTPGADRRALQRDARLPLHEQRRAGVRGHAHPGRPSAGRERCTRQGRRLLPSRQDHPGGEEPRRRPARLRGHLRLCAELRAGRAHPDQASGGGAAAGRHGDAHRGGARAAWPRRAGGRRQRGGCRHAVQHGQGVRLGRDHEGRAARHGAARRQRRDARLRRGEDLPRCRDLPAHGRDRGHFEAQDREGAVSGDGGRNMRGRRLRPPTPPAD